jgi:hypothetical protein
MVESQKECSYEKFDRGNGLSVTPLTAKIA